MSKKLQIATVFSGIGAVEQALNRMKIDYDIVFACDNGERKIEKKYDEIMEYCNKHSFNNNEINEYVKELYNQTKKPNYMKINYFANYKIEENNWYEDIRFIDGSCFENKVDLFVGGSPCQSFSLMGKRGGLDDARGTLFFNYANLISQIKPKVFIYENVPGMIKHDNGKTWEIIKNIFYGLGYNIYYKVLNSMNFGIPQNRSRLFVIGFKNKTKCFTFPAEEECNKTVFDYLEKKVDANHYLGKKGFEFVTNPRYYGRARVNSSIMRTQKANQQFNWNGDFIFEEYEKVKDREDVLRRAYVGEWNNKKGVIRQLSYRECFRLMGFSDSFDYSNVPNMWRYRQAGNSIVVDVLIKIIEQIIKVEDFNEKD